ncbi:uncharacterized protein LOC144129894 [Amblyomma americanum]
MAPIAYKLYTLSDIGYTIYADDITIWSTRGSLTAKEQALQTAIGVVEHFVQTRGMQCASDKSEMIFIHGPRYRSHGPIMLKIHNHPIEKKSLMRVLGLWVQHDGKPTHTIATRRTSVLNIARMVRHIAGHRKDMREDDTIRLVTALAMSRIQYGLPYHNVDRTAESKIDILIRTLFKATLGLPMGTSTTRLLAIGIHNMLAETQEAALNSQQLVFSPPWQVGPCFQG